MGLKRGALRARCTLTSHFDLQTAIVEGKTKGESQARLVFFLFLPDLFRGRPRRLGVLGARGARGSRAASGLRGYRGL